MPVEIPANPVLKAALREAVRRLYDRDFFLLKQGLAEPAVASALKTHIAACLPVHCGLDVDSEYNRMTPDEQHAVEQVAKHLDNLENWDDEKTGDVWPDVIVHSRTDGKHNTLVLELKIVGRQSGKDRDWDRAKLQEFTRPRGDKGLGYALGCFMDISPSVAHIEWFSGGQPEQEETISKPGAEE